MSKITAISIMALFLIFVMGCGQKEIEPVSPETTTITEQNEAIANADSTLIDIQDTATDAELDDIEKTLEQI